MDIKELKTLIETLEDLGHTDISMWYEDGRDGMSNLVPIRAKASKLPKDVSSNSAVGVVFSADWT